MAGTLSRFESELSGLREKGNLRKLSAAIHYGSEINYEGRRMLNLSSNDYLGIASDWNLRSRFLETMPVSGFLPSASSSRLLTGNFRVYDEVETLLSRLFGTESALVFSSGYHMNVGILPAVCNSHTLILADKLVHASLIDGIRLSSAGFMRYSHNDYNQLEALLVKYSSNYETVIVVTESIFSMDGDEVDLCKLVELKKRFSNVMLYVDEAHAIGVRGMHGLGCAEEQGCISEIDFLVGTFGKAMASVGAYIVCRRVIRDYLVNKMRTFIFTTALPPVNMLWTRFILERMDLFADRREKLGRLGSLLRAELIGKNYRCPSTSHIIPIMIGDSHAAILKAEVLQRKGFYVLPVRPPTVPEGTSRIRLSLMATLSDRGIEQLINVITE